MFSNDVVDSGRYHLIIRRSFSTNHVTFTTNFAVVWIRMADNCLWGQWCLDMTKMDTVVYRSLNDQNFIFIKIYESFKDLFLSKTELQ